MERDGLGRFARFSTPSQLLTQRSSYLNAVQHHDKCRRLPLNLLAADWKEPLMLYNELGLTDKLLRIIVTLSARSTLLRRGAGTKYRNSVASDATAPLDRKSTRLNSSHMSIS